MKVLDKATEHFKSQLAGELLTIEVPEWETTVYYKSVMTFAQQQKAIQLHAKGEMVEALVETLIARALDADGKKMFVSADRAILLNQVDPEVITRIVTEMNNKEQQAQNNLGN